MIRRNPLWHDPELILSSISGVSGPRLSTFVMKYPKMVHGDFMTHRKFSRNASSSRAIPTHKLSATTAEEMYVPLFRYNQPGMQPGDYLSEQDQAIAAHLWREAAEKCLAVAGTLAFKDGLNVHKQWTNRMLEWFGYINVIVSATDWNNFVGLREELDDAGLPMAQDEIYWQADRIKDILANTTPRLLKPGEWHMPFILPEEESEPLDRRLKLSSARCASISYKTVDGKPMDHDRALVVYNKLVTARRMHASPLEHQGSPDPKDEHPEWHGNFTGWIQHRKMIPGECIPG